MANTNYVCFSCEYQGSETYCKDCGGGGAKYLPKEGCAAYVEYVNVMPKIKNVIFNPPATIVFWDDNSKTVVKCEGEAFDPEKGLAMAVTKRALGNKYEYYNQILHWLKKYEGPGPAEIEFKLDFTHSAKTFGEEIETLRKSCETGSEALKRLWETFGCGETV